MTISPLAAVQAYSQTQTGSTAASGDFGAALQSSINDAIQSGQTADKDATQALMNHGDLTQVVTAISHAELHTSDGDSHPRSSRSGLSGHHEDADLIRTP